MKHIRVTQDNHDQVIAQAVEVLNQGGLVLFPTETTYGAGVDATNQQAVHKLLSYKSRREGKPLSIAVPNIQAAEQYVELNDSARELYQRFLPGPVTVVSKSSGTVVDGVASEFNTLGVRIPDYPLMLELLQTFDKPITATSANGSGKPRPYTVETILEHLSEKQKGLIDLIIDAGELPKNPPSTVIDTTLSTPVTMRQGATQLKNAIDKDETTLTTHSEQETKDLAGKIVLKHWSDITENGLVIGLDGDLGTGKTIFTKGIADFLQITEPLTSPTYTYLHSHDFTRHGVPGSLHHLDVWKVDTKEQFELLEIPSLLQPNNVIVIEWWQQIKSFWQPPQEQLVEITLEDTGTSQRSITLRDSI